MLPFDTNDRLLLCSDGLYDYCRETDFIQVLSHQPLPDAADELVTMAKSRGGHDNITIVLAERAVATDETWPRETREIDLPFTRDLQLPQ